MLRPCQASGCPLPATVGGRCDTHAQALQTERQGELDRLRGTAASRGYGVRWRHLRARFLRAHPQCQVAGCRLPATDAHHRVAKRDGGPDTWDNLVALCHAHHSQITAAGAWARPGER